MLAIDHADDGFNLSLEAMNNLTCVKSSYRVSFADFDISYHIATVKGFILVWFLPQLLK
jgi:hypothetical protein